MVSTLGSVYAPTLACKLTNRGARVSRTHLQFDSFAPHAHLAPTGSLLSVSGLFASLCSPFGQLIAGYLHFVPVRLDQSPRLSLSAC